MLPVCEHWTILDYTLQAIQYNTRTSGRYDAEHAVQSSLLAPTHFTHHVRIILVRGVTFYNSYLNVGTTTTIPIPPVHCMPGDPDSENTQGITIRAPADSKCSNELACSVLSLSLSLGPGPV